MNNEPGHVGPQINPGWLDVARQVVMFLLGVFLILYSAMTSGHDIPFLLTGLALFGMIPVERALLREKKKVDVLADNMNVSLIWVLVVLGIICCLVFIFTRFRR